MVKLMRREKQTEVEKDTYGLSKIHIDYPQEGETIRSSSYTFRFTSKEPTRNIEVSINDGSWKPCRESLGLWWYDWSNYTPGDYELRARVVRPNGMTSTQVSRTFKVVLERPRGHRPA